MSGDAGIWRIVSGWPLRGDPTAGRGVFVAAGEQLAAVITQLSRRAATFTYSAGLLFGRCAERINVRIGLVHAEAQRTEFLLDLHRQRFQAGFCGVRGDVSGELANQAIPAVLAFEAKAHQVLGDGQMAASEQFGKFGEQPFGQFGTHR